MRLIINKEDINKISGNFIIQLNNEDEQIDITKSTNLDFWFEKRISFVSYHKDTVDCNGLFYKHCSYQLDDFIEYFNGKNKRFCRLLNKKELELLMNFFVERKSEFL